MKKSRPKTQDPHPDNLAGSGAPDIFRVTRLVAATVLVLLTVIVYANSLGGKFVFDDTVIVQGNESIQGLDTAHLEAIFGQHYWQAVESKGGLYRPMVMLSFAINYAMGGEDPVGYHIINILLHTLNGVLVFFVVEALFSRRTLSLLTALLFILHPIRTEAVASIVGRAESLSAGFALAAWLLYIWYHRSGRKRWLWYSSALFVMAVLSKESAFAFVALLLLTDYILGKGKPRDFFFGRSALIRYLPYGLAIAFTFLLRYWILGGLAPLYINPRSNPLVGASVWPRLLTATNVFGRYLGLLVWPMSLSADYSFNQIPLVTSVFTAAGFFPLLLVIALLAGALVATRRYPILLFSGFVFFSLFILTSNWLWPIGTIMGERLMYFPALGFNCAVAFLLCHGLSVRRWRTVSWVAVSVLLAGYGLRTFERNLDWRDHYHLFRSALRTSPESSLVQSNYASVLLNEKNDLPGAIEHAQKAVQIMPQDPAAFFTLGVAYHRLGELAKAAEALESVVYLAPRTDGGAAALREEAEVKEAMGNYAEAQTCYEKLCGWRPSSLAAWLGLGRIYLRQGKRDQAREALERCRRLDPDNPAVRQAWIEYEKLR